MIFWTLSLLMLAGAVLCILVPLSRKNDQDDDAIDSLTIYRQQLKELDERNDAPSEAVEAERIEISRRILRHSRQNKTSETRTKTSSMTKFGPGLIGLVAVPVIAIATYSTTGSPGLPDAPLSARATENLGDKSIEEMVIIAERHLAKNPEDVRGWKVLAGVYGRMNRPTDRANALREIIRLSAPTPQLLADLGEAITVSQGNVITEQANRLFDEALKLDPKFSKALLYRAIAFEQEGRNTEALSIWTNLSAERKDDPQWQSMIAQRTNGLRSKISAAEGNGPTREQVEAASSLSANDRMTMIEGMVSGLAEKLKDNPKDEEGWLRLIRSYSVLKKSKEAEQALEQAFKAFTDKPETLSRFQRLAQQLNLSSPTKTGDAE